MSESAEANAQLTQENLHLRARLRLLEDALENMSPGLCMFDAENRVVVHNRRYANIVALPVEEIRDGMTYRELVELGMAAGNYPPELSADEIEASMWEHISHDGSTHKLMIRGDKIYSIHPQRTPSGNLVSTFEDVTARTETEEALRKSKARLLGILDTMPECVKIFDEAGKIIYINPQGLELVQAPNMDAVIGQNMVPEEYLADCVEVHRQVLAGSSVNWSYELIGLAGRRLHVEANSVPHRMPDGRRAHMCISRDVTSREQAADALRRSEERLRLVQGATGLADFEAGPDGIILSSRQFNDQCGLPPDTKTLTTEEWRQVVHPDDYIHITAKVESALGRATECELEFRIVRPDNGEVRWISSRTTLERDSDGLVTRTVGAHLDITERKRAEEALRESEERFRLAAEAAGMGVWDFDPRTGRRDWSDRLSDILGFGPAVTPSLELATECVHADDRERFTELLHDLRDGRGLNRFVFTFRIARADNRDERWVTMNGWKAANSEGLSRVILTARDVTEEKTAEERIRWNASHDGLTQLANRSGFQDSLEHALRAAKKRDGQVGLLMIDLDHFKQVNDALGHDAGDRLLQTFSDRLRSAVRAGDTVARLGGDEFAILVPDLASDQTLADLASSIHERLREPFIHKGRVVDCRISVGAAIYPQHGTSPNDLMISADMALYSAKASGRSTTVEYRPYLRDEIQRYASMVSTARKALRDDRLIPYYQPQLDLAKGSIAGFEALLRWRDRKNCVHLPATIEAAFEDHEVAAAISDRVIARTISDMRLWLDAGINFGHVAVNASAAEFRRDDFAERVLESLQKADIPQRHFQLEVTETVFLGRGAEYVQRALALLSANGIKIALDDFGTGYASLRHLKQFPVDILKIDKSFVRDMGKDAGDEAIIRAVVNLGKNLGIKVVAEGIEDISQATRLIELGCDYGQGFLFSKAIPSSRVPSLVASFAERRAGSQALKLASGQN